MSLLLVSAARGVVPSLLAQTPQESALRLTVRPRTMATATRTVQAGVFSLDSLESSLVYVPLQCVGARRCPLLVSIHGGGQAPTFLVKMHRSAADRYGIIILAPEGIDGSFDWEFNRAELRNMDAVLKQVLRKFAIDPDKIALYGRSQSEAPAKMLGNANWDVFSRVITTMGGGVVDPANKRMEYIFNGGILDAYADPMSVRQLRQAGHPVKYVVCFKLHQAQVEEFDWLGRWLQESWTTPDPAARPAPEVVTHPLPLLTPEVLTKMTTFWADFLGEQPESIAVDVRRAYQREVAVPVVEGDQPSTVMVDMPALAAQYPSVAAALKKAGLTAQQHEAYRIALLSATIAKNGNLLPKSGVATSVLEKNAAFLAAHPQELEALAETGMWDAP